MALRQTWCEFRVLCSPRCMSAGMLYKDKNKVRALQRAYYCRNREAENTRHNEWRASNRATVNSTQLAWRTSSPLRQLLYYAKSRARRLGVPFDITVDDLSMPEVCPVLGIPIHYGARGRGRNQAAADSPSLDRIVPSLGYVKGNVIVVSWRANALKKDATVRELRALADFYGQYESPRGATDSAARS